MPELKTLSLEELLALAAGHGLIHRYSVENEQVRFGEFEDDFPLSRNQAYAFLEGILSAWWVSPFTLKARA